jgi:hypothetical protein
VVAAIALVVQVPDVDAATLYFSDYAASVSASASSALDSGYCSRSVTEFGTAPGPCSVGGNFAAASSSAGPSLVLAQASAMGLRMGDASAGASASSTITFRVDGQDAVLSVSSLGQGSAAIFNLTSQTAVGRVAPLIDGHWYTVTLSANAWAPSSGAGGFGQADARYDNATFQSTAVPLPAAGWLLLSSLGGLAATARRSRRSVLGTGASAVAASDIASR